MQILLWVVVGSAEAGLLGWVTDLIKQRGFDE
jgi:hypothetical protein